MGILLVIAGCSKPEDKLVGTYAGKQQLNSSALSSLPKGAQAVQNMSLTLSLNKDKTATLAAPGQPALNGTWAYENNQVQITFGSGGGSLPMKLNPSPDNKTLTLDMSASPQAAAFGTIVFTKG